ncbi:trypsin-like serine protease [Streptomyces sp. NPDC101110]|uniref:trypsin-like serine protease n=1 Tax=unclassified Streptomyces TaxID=2593676 RepID=UPI00380B5C3A
MVPGKELCLKATPTGSSCHGDSGGPAIVRLDGKWRLIGATSRGDEACGMSHAIYTDVTVFRSWISEAVSEQAKPVLLDATGPARPRR